MRNDSSPHYTLELPFLVQLRLAGRAVGEAAQLAVLGTIAVVGTLVAVLGGEFLEVVGLGLVAVVGVAAAFGRPMFVAPLVALLLPAGQRIDVLIAQVAPFEALVAGAAIGYVARVLIARARPRIVAAEWVFTAFAAFVVLSLLGPGERSDRLHEVLLWLTLVVVFHVVRTHLRTSGDRGLLLVALVGAVVVEAVWAIFQYVDHWSERFSLLEGAIVYPLPTGSFLHANLLGQFLVVAAFLILSLASGQPRPLRILGWCGAASAFVAVPVTFSRASWLALVFGAAVYLVHRRARVAVVAGATVALAGAAFLVVTAGAIGDRISTLVQLDSTSLYGFRLELVRRAASAIASQPLTGVAEFTETGVYAGRADIATHPHNLFLGVAVAFGVPAALAFATLFALVVRSTVIRVRGRSDTDRLAALGVLAALVAMLVNGLFEYTLWNMTSLAVLVILVFAVALADDGPGVQQSEEIRVAGSGQSAAG